MSPRLIPRDQSFFPLYAAQAATAAEAARVLERQLRDYADPEGVSLTLRDLEHRGDQLDHELTDKLEAAFVLPFERDDMLALTGALDDIVDLIEKVGDMLVLYHMTAPPPGSADQAAILVEACDVIVEAIAALPDQAALRRYPSRIHALEKDGDSVGRRLIGDLFDDPTDLRALIASDDIYAGLEDAIDATDRVGRTLERIALG